MLLSNLFRVKKLQIMQMFVTKYDSDSEVLEKLTRD